ncbi:MAG: hypothetical protein EAZ70_03070 [Runella slithyformis]|jgi:hypothetical protein|nr:MAG: hypothetical protein EAZ70_03070 [Runella slithyformis]TAF48748.1 MAG: hypothetical protein EAZ63_04175 [Runella slithyformis]TAF78988.1 MAG: hypothetical protein EAZ50_12580 [Runella slithyformis]
MSSIELKSNFHQLIDTIQDERMLRDLYDCLVDFTIDNNTKQPLLSEQLARIQSSLEQIEKGQLIDNETIKQKVKQWLSK